MAAKRNGPGGRNAAKFATGNGKMIAPAIKTDSKRAAKK